MQSHSQHPAFISTVGCSLISSSIGTKDDLLLRDAEIAAFTHNLIANPYFAASPATIVSLVGTILTANLAPLVAPDGTQASGSFDPVPFPGFIIQLLGSDLDRVVGNTFTLTWTFASLRYGSDAAITHTATLQLDKPGARGTFIGIIPATVVAGKSRMATPRIWRPGAGGSSPDTLTIAALATGMTAQARLLTAHDGAFQDLWPSIRDSIDRRS